MTIYNQAHDYLSTIFWFLIIIFFEDQIITKLKKKTLLNLDGVTEGKLSDVLVMLRDYQVAVYLHAFSSFLEVMLLENLDSGYMDSVVKKIEEHALGYRDLYTKAYNQIELQAQSTLQQHVLGGLSLAGNALGSAIEKTPIGDATPIDEALIDASKAIGQTKQLRQDNLMNQLSDVKMADVRPFIDSINSVNALYNKSAELLTDGESLYFLSSGDDYLDGCNQACNTSETGTKNNQL